MSTSGKYIDVSDYGNIENVIKKVDPSFVDITARMDPQIANYAQNQMSLAFAGKHRHRKFEKPHREWIRVSRGIRW